jgi:uncharacterized membrane protein YjjB (DUF3815 family)
MSRIELLQIVTGFLGSVGFAILFNIRGKRLAAASVGGGLSWLFYLLLNRLFSNDVLCYFLVSVLLAIYAEVMARMLKTPTTTFITTGLIPLVPGSSLYYTMTYAFSRQGEAFLEKGIHTLGLAGALAFGIILVAGVTAAWRRMKGEK